MVHYSLAYLKAKGETITAYCEAQPAPGGIPCRHSERLDWDKLIAAFGPDFVIPDAYETFISRLKCSRCGSRRVSIILTPREGIGQTTGH